MAQISSIKKLKASSLIEVLIALIIIMVVFGIATLTYLKIVSSSTNTILEWQQELATLAAQAKRSPNLADRDYTLPNEVTVNQRLVPCPLSENLRVLELEAKDRQQKVLGVYREIIRKSLHDDE